MAEFLISAFADEANNSLEGQIAALKRNRLRCLEPRSVSGGIIEKSDAELAAIRERLDAEGIGLSSLGSPIGKYGIDEDFDSYLSVFHRALAACRILGTPRMRIFSFFVPQERLKECRAEVMRRLSILLEEAEKAGVILCHENESAIYGQNPTEVEDLLQSLPGLRGIFDAANYLMNDQDPMEGFRVTLPKLEYMHVKDMVRTEKAMVPVGMGDGCYAEVIKRVDQTTDRTVFLTIEPHLSVFDSYGKIDSHVLKTGVQFESRDAAFDCAVRSMKTMLTELGFREGEDLVWRK